MYSTIVHPTDFSEASVPALHSAHELAKSLGSKLLICFIANPPLVASADSLTDPNTQESRNIAEELEQLHPAEPGLNRELRLVVMEQSMSVKSLLKFLEDMDCGLLVLGMHNRPGIKGWLLPSITEEVVRRAECPVLVVKHHEYEYKFDESDAG